MSNFKLRPYQQKAVDRIRAAYIEGHQGVMLVAPTGSGKTVIFSKISEMAHNKGSKIIILAHRRELLIQASNKLRAFSVSHGIIQGKKNTNPGATVQVCSIDTIKNRELWFDPNLIIIDEAHLASAARYKDFLEKFPTAKRLAVTATPIRLDGKGFEHLASEMIQVASVPELIGLGHLVRPVIYTADIPELASLASANKREFDQEEISALMRKRHIIGGVIGNYEQYAKGRKTVVFCVGIEHAKDTAAEFNKAGYLSAHIDGTMGEWQRNDILNRLKRGELQIVCNANVLCEGWDEPSIEAVILARPTKSEALYIQQAGRGLRPYPGKSDCIILDHGGNTPRFGPVDAPREWSLYGRKVKKQKSKKEKLEDGDYRVCMNCFKPSFTEIACEHCGYIFPKSGIGIEEVNEDLKPYEKPDNLLKYEYVELIKVAKSKKKPNGRPYHKSWAWFQMAINGYSHDRLIEVLGMSEVPYKIRERMQFSSSILGVSNLAESGQH